MVGETIGNVRHLSVSLGQTHSLPSSGFINNGVKWRRHKRLSLSWLRQLIIYYTKVYYFTFSVCEFTKQYVSLTSSKCTIGTNNQISIYTDRCNMARGLNKYDEQSVIYYNVERSLTGNYLWSFSMADKLLKQINASFLPVKNLSGEQTHMLRSFS